MVEFDAQHVQIRLHAVLGRAVGALVGDADERFDRADLNQGAALLFEVRERDHGAIGGAFERHIDDAREFVGRDLVEFGIKRGGAVNPSVDAPKFRDGGARDGFELRGIADPP